MKPVPRVTAVIPTWNWSRALRCAITSALRQTFTDFELLVVGDGCTDDSAEVVASFDDPRVKWHNLPQNAGSQSAPNNAALGMARGEYIAYLGHDDLWLPDHLESLVRVADEKNADLVTAVALILGPQESGLRVIAGFLPDDTSTCDPFAMGPSAVFHRVDAARAIGGWSLPDDCVLSPDVDFVKRCWEYRRKVASTGRLSVIKFNASWRPNIYITRDASEQEEWMARIENEKGFLESELHKTLASFAAGKLSALGPIAPAPASLPKGWSAARMRHIRGISGQAIGMEKVPGGLRFTADHHGLIKGWHFPEATPDTAPFRWTGPETQSACEFTDVPTGSSRVRIRLVDSLCPDQLAVELKINGETIPLTGGADSSNLIFEGELKEPLLSTLKTSVELRVPRVVRPCDLNPDSPDQRFLGVRFSWIEFLTEAVPS